jgi:hypothetical protein
MTAQGKARRYARFAVKEVDYNPREQSWPPTTQARIAGNEHSKNAEPPK